MHKIKNKKICRILRTLCVFASQWLFPLQAQVDVFGYIETEADQIQLVDASYNFGYGKIRLDAEYRPWEGLLIGGNVNGQKYFGKTEWDFFDFLPYDSIKTEYGTINSMPVSISDTLYLDNFYTRLNFPAFDLTIGRQQISLGTGYAWNPLDIFNLKDLLDPTYEQPGVDAIRVEIPLNDRSSLDVIVADDDSTKNGAKMVQVKTGIGSFDITVNYAHRYYLFPYWRVTDIVKTHTLLDYLGGSFVGQIGEFGLWSEMLWSIDDVINFGEFVFGADHTFDNGVYIMTEYFHNTLGATKKELSFYNYIHTYSSESKSLMQNYLFVLTMFRLNDFISGSFMAFGNLDDGSFSAVPQIEWNAFENVTFILFVSQSFGDDDTEFGIQDRALRLRMRAYF